MKATIVVSTVMLVAIIGWAYIAHPFKPGGVAVSELYDRTDSILLSDAGEVLALFDFRHRTWEALEYRCQAITDVAFNPVHVERLPSGFALFGNPGDREDSINAFRENVLRRIDVLNRQPFGLPKSSIYAPLLWEVNRMAESDFDRRIVVLRSNCLENSRVFSVHTAKGKEMLLKDPAQVKALLLKCGKPANLAGITVFIIYRPSALDNEMFVAMSGLFKEILEEAGAEVHIGANLIFEPEKSKKDE